MDIGIWMASEVLAHKLQARVHMNPEQAWSLSRWPKGLSDPGPHRLFVASDGAWRGYFVLAADALYNPNDPAAPFTLLFDVRSWHAIPPVSVTCFRGFSYHVPSVTKATRPPSP